MRQRCPVRATRLFTIFPAFNARSLSRCLLFICKDDICVSSKMSSSDREESDKMEMNLHFGQWTVERILGSGTYGKVMLMKHRSSEDRIAVKKCHSNSPAVDPDQWKKELEILHSLRHPCKHATQELHRSWK